MHKRGEVTTVYNLRVAEYHTYFVGSRAWGFSLWAHNANYVVLQHGSTFRLAEVQRNGTLRLVDDARGNGPRIFASKRAAENAAKSGGGTIVTHSPTGFGAVSVPDSIAIPGANPNEIVNSLPRFVRAPGISDNAHGLLVVNGRAYRLSSGGPNVAAGYSQNLAPRNASDLVPAFTTQTRDHVEGSACALLRRLRADGEEIKRVQLYLNRDALCGGQRGCGANIDGMLPEGVTADIFGTITESGRLRAIELGSFTGR